MSKKKAIFSFLVVVFGLVLTFSLVRAFTTSSPGYANNGAPQRDAYAGTTNVLIMDVSLPDPGSDTTIAGTAPTAGTTITGTKDSDWTTLYFYDAAAGGAWNASADIIFVDDGNIYYDDSLDTHLAGATTENAQGTLTEPTGWNLYYYDKTDSDAWDSSNDWMGTDDDSSGYYNGDKISSVKVENLENALDDDISAIKIWQEDDTTAGFQSTQDTLIGSDSSGAKWGQTISTGSAVVYTASTKDRIYVTADIATGAINGRIIKAKIPVNGLQLVSTSDGPTDDPIVNPYNQTIISGTTGSSVDNTAPSSSITDPTDGARIEPGVDYTIEGTCSDEGGSSVMQVEISLDGGTTWYVTTPGQAVGSGFNWQYLWQNPQEGTYVLKTRATDWVGNTETPGDGITVEVREITCSDYTSEDDCTTSGCYWYEDTCHTEAQALTCLDYTIEDECVSAGCYWYEDSCHQEEQVTEEQPTEEKPISEMTAEELEAKILEIQQQIVELLQQLIEMIKQQILELGGSL
jgi:hypothetical protein